MTHKTEIRAFRLAGDRPVAEVLRGFADDAGVVCLRGSWAGGSDLIASEPLTVHSGQAGDVPAAWAPGAEGLPAQAAVLTALREQPLVVGIPPGPHYVGGGWFGVLGYPTGRALHGLPDGSVDRSDRATSLDGSTPSDSLASLDRPGLDGSAPLDRPASWLAYYDHVLRYDRAQQVWWFEALWTPERAAELARRQRLFAERLRAPAIRRSYCAGPFTGAAPDPHVQAVERCITHIRAGDIFQVNIALRLDAEFNGSTVDLFADVSDELRPAFGAYVDTGSGTLAGFSPELFLRRRGRTVTTAPIKGTRPRTGIADDREAEVLRDSVKDAAENVMIVDLMRNDLGRVCGPGSVTAPALLEIQPHPGVWHLVSTVAGVLPDGLDDADLIAATFPPGSVTGAPKTRAMQLIDTYEDTPRQAFTGSVGFVSPVYGAEWSVTIRSFEIGARTITLWAGGGITVDSVPIEEWRECLIKARPLLRAAGFRLAAAAYLRGEPAAEVDRPPQVVSAGGAASLGRTESWSPGWPAGSGGELPDPAAGVLETVLVRGGHLVALADHLARLERSCRELYGLPLPPDLIAMVTGRAGGFSDARLRIVLTPVGERLDVEVTVAPLTGPTGVRQLVTADRPAGVWRHKYADRRWLAAAEQGDALPLFVDADGHVLETSRGNVFVVGPDGLRTPPADDAILPGVTRRLVLDAAFDLGIPLRIEPVPLALIRSGYGVFTTSAISRLTHIDMLDGEPLPAAGELERSIAAAMCVRE